MGKRLVDNINSSYFEAAHKLYPKGSKRKVIAYVESYEDVGFWRDLLSAFETDDVYFQVTLPSATSLSKGKRVVLLNTLNADALGNSLIACVDSDFDYLSEDITPLSRQINHSPYVFQTYVYAIENYHCYAQSLHNALVQATLNDHRLIDLPAYMSQYSRTIYPLFLWLIWYHRHNDTRTFPMHAFNEVTRISRFNPSNPELSLKMLERNVETKIRKLSAKDPQVPERLGGLSKTLEKLGVQPDNTYLFIQGHHLLDNVVLRLLTPLCSILRREREGEIRRLAEHEQQYQNELTAYDNNLLNIHTVLKKNNGYKELPLYQKLKADLEGLLKEISRKASL